jgi:hypothetical protein
VAMAIVLAGVALIVALLLGWKALWFLLFAGLGSALLVFGAGPLSWGLILIAILPTLDWK